MRFGILVPHFGVTASRETVVRLSSRAEELGFRSIWVRDHLIWSPHRMEGPDKTFLDPFLTLAAISAVTRKMTLGTGVVIPIRWPLKLAQNFSSLSFLNEGRIIAGIGLGFNPEEFAGAGFDIESREEILRETIDICRQAWEEGFVDYAGDVFQVAGIELSPRPLENIPIVYGGNTPRAVRRAVDLTDGWYPGRLPIATLRQRLDYMREYGGEKAERMLTIIQPLVVVAEDRKRAESLVPIQEVAHSSAGAKNWIKPESGEYRTIQDLEGLVVCGTPDDVVEQIMAFDELGIDEFIFDFRLQYEDYEEILELVGETVLCHFTTDAGTYKPTQHS